MPEKEPEVQHPPEDQVPKEGEKKLHFLKVDRSLRPDGFHLGAAEPEKKDG